MKTRIGALAVFFAVLVPAIASASQGILVLAHDGTPDWTAQVKELAAKVDAQKPVEVVFGIPSRSSIASAVDRLAGRGATAVVAVPFFITTAISPEDLTGHTVPVRLGSAGAVDPVLAEIVLQRADEISPGGREVLVILGYGADDGGKSWAMDLDPIARRLNGMRRFASILTIARPLKRTEAEQQQIQRSLERQIGGGKAIIAIPLVGSGSGSDGSAEQALQGFSYRTAKGGVITDERMVDWLARQGTSPER